MIIEDLIKEESKSVVLNLINKNSDIDQFIKQTIIEKGELDDSDWEKIAYLTAIGDIRRKAKNIYKTKFKAEKIIEENKIDIRNKPDSDLLNYYEDLVSNVSNEDMQEIWARILVKEHMEHGSVTKAMLSALSLLDRKTALAFQKLCMYTFGLTVGDKIERFIPFVLYDDLCSQLIDYAEDDSIRESIVSFSNDMPSQEELIFLDEIGLIKLSDYNDESYVFTRECEEYVYQVGNQVWNEIPVFDEGQNNYFMGTGQAFFTHSGLVLFKALNIQCCPEIANIIRTYHKYGKECW
ncbi:MAG: DUF2806 domain-containing protein [Lachnospiraceae bacterium]|nr:DUF2806 domain-containing protein [Lachnospiraceae bacterium]